MRSRAGVVVAVVLALGAAQASAATASVGGPERAAAPQVRASGLTGGERHVRRYWTAERMREAEPLGPLRSLAPRSEAEAGSAAEPAPRSHGAVNRFEVTDTSAYPARVHGKVFLSFEDDDFVCSGTAVGSPAENVVVSAGHCVFDAGFTNEWATNWMFIPGYREGEAPFGRWVAENLATTRHWVEEADIRFDIGAAAIEPRGASELEQAVGARGIAFNQPRDQLFRAFGYPAQQPPLEFTGERLFACDSPWGGGDETEPPPSPMRIACDMTQGSSGGGWVIDDTYVNSVISYGYLLEPNDLYGPYFGADAAAVYERIAGRARCFGQPATLIGTAAADTLRGTGAPDVILGLGGDDEIRARGGKDLVCAGPDADTVRGGPGGDRLAGQGESDTVRGQSNRDSLNGGTESDLCDGGPGRDSARRCEDERHVR